MKLAHRKMRIFVRKNKYGKFSKTPKMDKLILKDTHNPKLNILECDSKRTHKLKLIVHAATILCLLEAD